VEAVQAVIDVTSYGGLSKEYHVEVDPVRLKAAGSRWRSCLRRSQTPIRTWAGSAGGRSAVIYGARCRAHWLPQGRRRYGCSRAEGVPFVCARRENVSIGWSPRLGIVGRTRNLTSFRESCSCATGRDRQTLNGVQARLAYIRQFVLLPIRASDILPYYDRGALVNVTTRTGDRKPAHGMGLWSSCSSCSSGTSVLRS